MNKETVIVPYDTEKAAGSIILLLSVFGWCYSKLFPERGMKMALTGETQEFTDRTDGLIRVLQQFSSFFQFTAQDECTDGEAKRFLKISRKVRFAESDIISDISDGKMLICILLNISNGFLHALVC